MNSIRFLFVSLCVTLESFSFLSYAQLKDVINVPSPDVASLGMFGNTPVGYFTGTPDISVPLYQLQISKSLALPISADYHPGNVKPHNPPTTLGIGWVLNCGGYISRKVKGICDESAYKGLDGLEKKGFIYNYSKLKRCENETMLPSVDPLDTAHVDLSADEFSFSFMGHQGSFFLDMNGKWQVCSDENIKVEFDENSDIVNLSSLGKRIFTTFYRDSGKNQNFIIGFTLVTSDGTRFTFGGIDATEFCIHYYGQVRTHLISSCWRLSKIKTVDNHEISFEYATDGRMCDVRYAPQFIRHTNKSGSRKNHGFSADNNKEIDGYTGFLLMPVRLTKISSKTDILEFNYELDETYGNQFEVNSDCLYYTPNIYWTGWSRAELNLNPNYNPYNFYGMFDYLPTVDNLYRNKKGMQKLIAGKLKCYYLKSICVRRLPLDLIISFDIDKKKHHSLLKEISYFNQDVLSSLPVKDGKDYMSYKFSYYNEDNKELLWPTTTPKIYTDSWEYYCGYGDGLWRIPADIETCRRIRNPRLETTKTYVLKEIVYPTGGSSKYEYELNDYSKLFDLNKGELVTNNYNSISGGLRVCSITDYDMNGERILKREFIYEDRGMSSGISKGLPSHYNKVCFNKDIWIEVISAESVDVYPMNFNSPDVGYSVVTENVYDKNDKIYSKTRYTFTNYDLPYNPNLQKCDLDLKAGSIYASTSTSVTPFTSYAFERGKLLSREIYDERDSLIEKDTYNYCWSAGDTSVVYDESNNKVSWFDESNNYCPMIFAVWYKYNVFTNRILLAEENRNIRCDSVFVKSKKCYVYNKYRMPIIICTYSPLGLEDEVYTYTNEGNEYKDLTRKNIILPETTVIQRYRYSISNTKTYSLTDQGVPYVSKETMCTEFGEKKAEEVLYEVRKTDEYGNPVVIDEKGYPTYILWGCYGLKPVVVAKWNNGHSDTGKSITSTGLNSLIQKLDHDNNAEIRNNFYKTIDGLRMNGFLIKTYLYSPNTLLLSETTDEKGLITSYSYDIMGRLISESQKNGDKFCLKSKYQYEFYRGKENKVKK